MCAAFNVYSIFMIDFYLNIFVVEPLANVWNSSHFYFHQTMNEYLMEVFSPFRVIYPVAYKIMRNDENVILFKFQLFRYIRRPLSNTPKGEYKKKAWWKCHKTGRVFFNVNATFLFMDFMEISESINRKKNTFARFNKNKMRFWMAARLKCPLHPSKHEIVRVAH